MAESFVIGLAVQISYKLSFNSWKKITEVWGVESEFNRLEFTLSAIKAVLLDASEQQEKARNVRDWLEKLQDVLYDFDELLDDFMTEDMRRKVFIKGSKRKEVSNFFSSSNPLAFRVNMSQKVQKLITRLEDIAAGRRDFQFTEQVLLDPRLKIRSREQTHSFIHSSDVIGRDHDKQRIVELLLNSASASKASGTSSGSGSSSSSSNKNVSVLAIVGLGGLGKTTLTKYVYNDDAIVSHFKARIWVCVSEDFDLKKVIEKIINDATGVDKTHLDLNQLQTRLRRLLSSKKFLLVLDDVWNEDPKKWEDLKDLLNCGAQGSKIVVTTRSRTTARIMGTSEPYDLSGLSNDECMSIFVKCAFREGEETDHPKLVEIGKAIVNKCRGLPLAVRTLGSLLYAKTEEQEWLYVKDNDTWKIVQKENDILPILKLSYDELPVHLKQCFAYWSMFPKDSEITIKKLICLWVAQGFIQSSDGSQELENIGRQYFNELSSRFFLQDCHKASDSEVLCVKMHDLVHDLAISVAGREFSQVKFDTKVISERTRHLLFCEKDLQGKKFPDFLLKLNKVRSFSFAFKVGPVSKTFLNTLIKIFPCLRVLDLTKSEFEELPDTIGTLKYLRYLSLYENNTIKTLPNSICNLVNLQTLNLLYCVKLQDLPRNFGNLWSLRYLHLTSQITRLPEEGLEGFSSLQYMSITRCNNLESLSTGMRYLTALRELHILRCPSLMSLPKSLSYLTSLEKLRIIRCEKLSLFEEGMELQRNLKSLEIIGLQTLRELPREHGAASTLTYLCVQDCPSLRTFPGWLNECTSLSKFEIVNCRLLGSLPLEMHQLVALRVLRIKGSPHLIRKCSRETGEYWRWISHIPDIQISALDSPRGKQYPSI